MSAVKQTLMISRFKDGRTLVCWSNWLPVPEAHDLRAARVLFAIRFF